MDDSEAAREKALVARWGPFRTANERVVFPVVLLVILGLASTSLLVRLGAADQGTQPTDQTSLRAIGGRRACLHRTERRMATAHLARSLWDHAADDGLLPDGLGLQRLAVVTDILICADTFVHLRHAHGWTAPAHRALSVETLTMLTRRPG